jgi:hypothetical protein
MTTATGTLRRTGVSPATVSRVLHRLGANAVVPALAAFKYRRRDRTGGDRFPTLIAVHQLLAAGRDKPVRAAPLVYALSAVNTVLGGYWFLTTCSSPDPSPRLETPAVGSH